MNVTNAATSVQVKESSLTHQQNRFIMFRNLAIIIVGVLNLSPSVNIWYLMMLCWSNSIGCKIYFTAVMYVFCTDLNRHNHYTQQLQTTSQPAISHNKKWKLSEEYTEIYYWQGRNLAPPFIPHRNVTITKITSWSSCDDKLCCIAEIWPHWPQGAEKESIV